MVCLLTATTVQADTLTDDFSQGISATRWTVTEDSDVPWAVTAAAGKVDIQKPSDPTGPDHMVTAGVASTFWLSGDFDVKVDFTLVNWPSPGQGYNTSSLYVTDQDGHWRYLLGRKDLSPQSSWEDLHFQTAKDFSVLGTHDGPYMSGTYEFQRTGSTLSAYVDVGTGRSLVGSVNDPTFTGLAGVGLFCQQQDRPTTHTRSFSAIDVQFDNFVATADSIVPEPVTLSLLALSGLAILRRRRR